MTKEEAREWVDIARMGYICDPQECGLEKGGDPCKAFHCDEIHDALVMAMEALEDEKQIPKAPDYEGDGYCDGELVYDTWICPCCGMYYEVDYDNYTYCPNCGQAIDWSDEK